MAEIRPTRKTTRLRALLESAELEFLMEAHSGLSAKVAEEAGFAGLWGSGLSISAACGVRDNNELSWTQVLEILEYITDAVQIPLLLDGDTGYGNFNNMRRLVQKLEARDVAGVCIEDKLFPKTNSFIDGSAQPLADIDEFAGKIKAGKDAQSDDDFVIVARVEAFIAGWGLEEALKRASAYHAAGADAILMHSKISRPDEVLSFKREWGDRCPVVIVPTKYYHTPTAVFREAGFSVVIWANHLMRASISAMRDTAAQLLEEQSLINVEERVVPVSEVFRLQGAGELKEAERRYLPSRTTAASALILAASRGKELGELTRDRPKCMLPVAGKPLLARLIGTFNEVGIKKVAVVRGYRKEAVDLPNVDFADNDEHAETQTVYSLSLGIDLLPEGPALISYGDVLYQKYIPMQLMESAADFCLAVNIEWEQSQNLGRYGEYVRCDRAWDPLAFDRPAVLEAMPTDAAAAGPDGIHGEWIGLMKVSSAGLAKLKRLIAELRGGDELRKMRMVDLIERLLAANERIEVMYTRGHWFDIDESQDLLAASGFGRRREGRER